jgi:hypothetical protein
MNKYHLTRVSSNRKTGPIPVSTTTPESCPPTCPLKEAGCYAAQGKLGLWWRQVKNKGVDVKAFAAQVAKLPEGQIWRHNQAGDLPHTDGRIDVEALQRIVDANRGKRGFTYTHHSMLRLDADRDNRSAVLNANLSGFTVNLSGDSLRHADQLADLNIGPVVAIVEPGGPAWGKTPAGRNYVVCPAQRREYVTCATCQICAKKRTHIVAFEAHGSQSKRVINIVRQS